MRQRWECVDVRIHSELLSEAELRWERRLGGLVSDARPEPMTRARWRQVPIASFIEQERDLEARAIEAEQRDAFQPASDAGRAEVAAEHDRWTRWRPGTPGRPRAYDRAFFEQVATEYRQAIADGRDPTKAVADAHGVARGTAAHWVWRARNDYHLLDPTTRGMKRGRSPR